jgi:hypothetical protein
MASSGAMAWRWASLGALVVSLILLALAPVVFVYAVVGANGGFADPDVWIPLSYMMGATSVLADLVALGAGLMAWRIERKAFPPWLYLVIAWLGCKLAAALTLAPRLVS